MRHMRLLFAGLAILAAAPVAHASFHVMQIEQVIGGIGGNNTRQAIQLRMRTDFQNQVQQARIRAWDATGSNPVVLVDFTTPVAIFAGGSRVLAATTGYSANGQGPTPDFTMQPIPASYLAAGKITFEDDFGIVLWSLCWGGASYTGTNLGEPTNDVDGNFGPCFPGPLPVADGQAVRFTGAAGAPSTTNLADYALTPAAATFTNNAGAFAVVLVILFADGFETAGTLAPKTVPAPKSVALPPHGHHDHGTGFFPDPATVQHEH